MILFLRTSLHLRFGEKKQLSPSLGVHAHVPWLTPPLTIFSQNNSTPTSSSNAEVLHSYKSTTLPRRFQEQAHCRRPSFNERTHVSQNETILQARVPLCNFHITPELFQYGWGLHHYFKERMQAISTPQCVYWL